MTIKNRLDLIISELGYSGREFSKRCGFSEAYYATIKDGIGADKLNKILSNFPQISAYWLVTGKGEMLSVETKTNIDNIPYERELFLSGKPFRMKSDNKANKIFRYRSEKGENFEGWVACSTAFRNWRVYAYVVEIRESFFMYRAFEKNAFKRRIKGIVSYRELEFLY